MPPSLFHRCRHFPLRQELGRAPPPLPPRQQAPDMRRARLGGGARSATACSPSTPRSPPRHCLPLAATHGFRAFSPIVVPAAARLRPARGWHLLDRHQHHRRRIGRRRIIVRGGVPHARSFCLRVNKEYTDAGPFISALQVIQLDDPVYNATDFQTSTMGLIAQTKFGSTGGVERQCSIQHSCMDVRCLLHGSADLICALNNRLIALSFYIREYYWFEKRAE